jgi:quercetin dioxygenase-like cupin family protein
MNLMDFRVPPVRRVVTGHDMNKTAKVIRDAAADNINTRPKAASTTIWCSEAVPVVIGPYEGGEDLGARKIASGTPPNGTRFMIMDLFPGCEGAMHRTDTLDYVVVIEGEVEMKLENSSVVLRAGDVLVQQATNHAWVNRTDKHARLAIVLVDGSPLGEGFAPARHGAQSSNPGR